jgi:hypothetical protein
MAAMNDVATQRAALHDGALLLDEAGLGTLVTTGSDRAKWLNGMVTCDVAALRPGDGALGLAVAKTGKLLAELALVADDAAIYVALPRDRAEWMQAHLDRHLIMEDAVVVDASADHAWLVAHGPAAADVVAAAREAGAVAALVDRTGRGGAVVVAKASAREAVRAAVLERLGARGALATPDAWDALRVEEGVGRFGVDFDEENYPQEASLERRAVSFSKGCYLGQEAVFMLEKRGHAKKRLVRVDVEGAEPLARGAEVALPDGAAVGQVTSRAPGPAGGEVALAYVKWKHATAGTPLVVGGRPARVA